MMILKTCSRPRKGSISKDQPRNKEHMRRIADMGCCICGAEAVPHHIKEEGKRVLARKPSDYETIPLCPYHHTGAEGIHVIGVKTWELKYGSQRQHLLFAMSDLRSSLAAVGHQPG